MKRGHKLTLTALFGLSLWLYVYSHIHLVTWLAIPVAILAVVGVYACTSIALSISRIKDCPQERTSLEQDITRARSFY